MTVGDVNSTARGSGARYNSTKTKWSLMPLHLLDEVADVWEYGAKKYAAWNWAKGMPWSVPYECIVRHLFKWFWLGERNDRESGKSHLAHIICNVMMLMHYEKAYPEGDDRPVEVFNNNEDPSIGYRNVPEHSVCVGPVQAEHRSEPDSRVEQGHVLCVSVGGPNVGPLAFGAEGSARIYGTQSPRGYLGG